MPRQVDEDSLTLEARSAMQFIREIYPDVKVQETIYRDLTHFGFRVISGEKISNELGGHEDEVLAYVIGFEDASSVCIETKKYLASRIRDLLYNEKHKRCPAGGDLIGEWDRVR